MESPDKIYVSRPIYNQCGLVISEDKPIKYVRKGFLIEWAKDNQEKCLSVIEDTLWQEIINKLNSL